MIVYFFIVIYFVSLNIITELTGHRKKDIEYNFLFIKRALEVLFPQKTTCLSMMNFFWDERRKTLNKIYIVIDIIKWVEGTVTLRIIHEFSIDPPLVSKKIHFV